MPKAVANRGSAPGYRRHYFNGSKKRGEERALLRAKRLRLERRRNEIARGLTAQAERWTALREICEEIEILNRQLEPEASVRNTEQKRPA